MPKPYYMPSRAQAPWVKYKWNALSKWGVNHKAKEVARKLVKARGIRPKMVLMENYIPALLARGLIVHTRYGHLVPGSAQEFFDVVNPVLWADEVAPLLIELDAETRLRGY